MNAEHLVIVASVSAGAGVMVRELGVTSGNRIIDAGAGAVVAYLAYKWNKDGYADIAEAAAIGYVLASVL